VATQRERLLEGMTHAAARHGYAGASVARVIERAGVSRATFYEHFRDREECFLEAYREIALGVRARVHGTAQGSSSAERPRAVLKTLLAGAAADPAATRLVLIEALGGPALARAENERLIAAVERSIEGFLGEEDPGATSLQIPAPALLGGIAGALSMRVLRRQTTSLSCLLEDLLRWIHSYALPPGERRLTQPEWEELGARLAPPRPHTANDTADPTLLPRGRAALAPGSVAASRRERLIEATARSVAEKGYAVLTVADVVAAARVPRGSFYAHFRGKQDAFLAAQTVGLQESIAAASAEFFVGADWPERVWGGLGAFLAYIGEHPDLAHLGIVEIQAAGEAAVLRDHDSRMAFALFLEDGYRQCLEEKPTAICSEAIAGGIQSLMRRRVLAGETERMLEILPQCAYVALAPFIGPGPALELVEVRARAAAPAA
jgi:AcrR family transcriptional regulator